MNQDLPRFDPDRPNDWPAFWPAVTASPLWRTASWIDGAFRSPCTCGDHVVYDPSEDAWTCWKCTNSCSNCRGASRAEQDYHAEMRRLRLTEGGTIKPLPASVYAAVVASGPCVYCGAPAEHADHVRPVAQGGSDNTGNLVPACGTCNHNKWGKLLTEWDPVRVAHGVKRSPVVAVEYARLTGTLVRS